MPTKENIRKDLISCGMPDDNKEYFLQLLDRHVPVVISQNADFGDIANSGLAHNYSYPQSLMILRYLLEKVRNPRDKTGHNLIQYGCQREQLSCLIGKYKEEESKQSSSA